MYQAFDLQMFLKIKEKLDYWKFPSTFMAEDMGLVSKLLSKLEQFDKIINLNVKGNQNDETQQQTRIFSEVEESLKIEIKRLFKQNNVLRRELWEAKEQVQQLKVKLINRVDIKLQKEIRHLDQIKILEQKNRRQQDLQNQLQEIRYKYNELIQLIHENPTFERQYIKRLIKHKKIEIKPNQKLSLYLKDTIQKIQVDSRIFGDASLLKSKVIARQQEILRLQTMLQQNNNYIHWRYQLRKKDGRQLLLQQEIDNLKQQIKYLKKILSSNNIKFNYKIKNTQNEKLQYISQKYNLQFKTNILDQNLDDRKHAQNNSKNKIVGVRSKGKIVKQNQDKIKKDPHCVKHVKQEINQQYFSNPTKGQANMKKNGRNLKSPPVQSNHMINQNNPSKLKKSEVQNNNKNSLCKNEQKKLKRYERLIEQKNNRILQLQQHIKQCGRSTKIISTNTLNTNNSPSNNLIIKTNKNEYININNINSNNQQKKVNYIQQQLVNAAKQRQILNKRVQNLQNQKYIDKSINNIDNQYNQIKDKYYKLQFKLEQTQNILVKTNQQNLLLQRQLNQFILKQKDKNYQPKIISKFIFQEKQIDQMQYHQIKQQLIFLRSEITRLRLQNQTYSSQRQILLARLKDLQFQVRKQSKQMRYFEDQVKLQKSPSSSMISSVRELQNQSQIRQN